MKVQSFLIALTTTLLVLFELAFSSGTVQALDDPTNVRSPKETIERTAKFFPKESELTFHWIADPSKTPKYVESITNNQPDQDGLESLKNLRNGLFALAGLDFENELAEWIDPGMSFALFNLNETEPGFQWVMALTSSKKNSAKHFLERFWLQEYLQGEDINIKEYRGISLIKSNQFNNTSNYKPLVTALIDDTMILIASDEATLKTSLNVSQFDDQNKAADKHLKDKSEQLVNGLALITLSPKALHSVLDFPNEIISQHDFSEFIVSFSQNKNNLILDGTLELQRTGIKIEQQTNELEQSLLTAKTGPAEGLGIIYSPYKLLKEAKHDPFRHLIAKLISDKLEGTKSLAAKTILALNKQTLIWIKEPDGWVIGTHEESPFVSNVKEVMIQDNQFKSNLLIGGEEFEVWSKLITKKINKDDKIETQFGVIRSKESGNDWWGQNLAALQERQKEGLQFREKQLEELNPNYKNSRAVQLALNEKYAQELLRNWRPWRILHSISGGSLKTLVKGLAISLDSELASEDSNVKLRASLQIA